ncbi:MAG: GNAT family N-acetyltransferase [Clostridium sp.]
MLFIQSQVLPELRNRHLGTAFLSALLPRLAKRLQVSKLQVSSENLPAMALYKNRVLHYANPVFL